MNPRTLISIAAAADDVLALAEKNAQSEWHWRQINRMASALLHGLNAIANDDTLLQAIRTEAVIQGALLRPIQHRSFEEIDRHLNKPVFPAGESGVAS